EITRKDGTVVKIEGEEPIKIQDGDRLTKVPSDVHPVKGEDGRFYLQSGDRLVPVELGASYPKFEPKPVGYTRAEVPVKAIGADRWPGFKYTVGDDTVNLWQQPGRSWIWPANRPDVSRDVLGPIKIDITALNADDARKVQQYLIPLLEKDPAFAPPKLLS